MTTRHYPSGFDFATLQSREGLCRLDAAFVRYLQDQGAGLDTRLATYRSDVPLDPLATSELLLALGVPLGHFLANLFQVNEAEQTLGRRIEDEHLIQQFKQQVVQRKARRYRKPVSVSFATLHAQVLASAGEGRGDQELAIARYGLRLLAQATPDATALDSLVQWAVLGLKDEAARAVVGGWVSFRQPQAKDYQRLIPIHRADSSGVVCSTTSRPREGFGLTDRRFDVRTVMDEVHYCIYCHDHDGDFCSKGFPEKKDDRRAGLRRNPLGVVLTGCPLNEKISEMHYLKRAGHSIAALAAAMADNPLVAATGHRICNDCMNACIYQKQQPVDIPQIETRVLTDVLELPWGVEIYDLLMRWNPLRRQQYLPAADNGRQVLIAGMGPAGFSLAHFLTMEGCTVVGIDARAINPMPEALLCNPVRDWKTLVVDLAQRPPSGFGGMSEQGIPARWDKNFLTLLHLCLARRSNFALAGGVHLGRDLRLEDCWQLGFDHVSLATGSGRARALPLPPGPVDGVMPAIDFLRRLQESPIAREGRLEGMLVRMPAVIIGGGLTAVDAATELQAFYICQAEAMLERFETLAEHYGEDGAWSGMGSTDLAAAREIVAHGRQVRAARQAAEREDRQVDFSALLRQWGGVRILYRGALEQSAGYRRNAQELALALAEGVIFCEHFEPQELLLDDEGRVRALRCMTSLGEAPGELELAAATVLVAVGLPPDSSYSDCQPGALARDGDAYAAYAIAGESLQMAAFPAHIKERPVPFFTSWAKHGYRVSFLGDTHPLFYGSVVKAIASAQQGWPQILASMDYLPPSSQPLDAVALASKVAATRLAEQAAQK